MKHFKQILCSLALFVGAGSGCTQNSVDQVTSAITGDDADESVGGQSGNGHHGHKPPQEAIDACAAAAAGDACSFSHETLTITGICDAPPAGAPTDAPALICHPAGGPHGHEGDADHHYGNHPDGTGGPGNCDHEGDAPEAEGV